MKWISATKGTVSPSSFIRLRMFGKLSASAWLGTVRRTISEPAFSKSAICWILASVSLVLDVIMDWIRIGFFPPIPTPPTITSRVGRLL